MSSQHQSERRRLPVLLALLYASGPLPAGAAEIEEIVVLGHHAVASYEAFEMTTPAPPWNLADLIQFTPDVALTGQGGRLQTFAVRGLGSERIRVLVDQAPIRALRRAGVSAAFLNSDWARISVTPGAAGTLQGTGTGAGLVKVNTTGTLPNRLAATFEGPGARRALAASTSIGSVSAGLGYLQGDRQSAPDGAPLNTSFEQFHGQFQHRYAGVAHEGITTLLAGIGRDLGKSNSDFPQRSTLYPRDDHLLLSHSYRHDRVGRLSGWLHDQRLDTRVDEDNETTRVKTSTLDYGLRYASPETLKLKWGADLFGRSDYDVVEDSRATLNDGHELAFGLFLTSELHRHALDIDWGLRLAYSEAGASGADDFTDTALLGHLGISLPLADLGRLRLSVNRAATTPTVSQLYFSGTTGRGSILGNPELRAERLWVYEAAYRQSFGILDVGLNAYFTQIDTFIEKTSLTDDVDTFVNATGGDIYGATASLGWTGAHRSLSAGLSLIRGTLDDGTPIRDIPNAEANLSFTSETGPGTVSLLVAYRFSSDRSAPDNLELPARTLLHASYRIPLTPRINAELFVRNLLDETYRETSDRKAALGAERSLGITLDALL